MTNERATVSASGGQKNMKDERFDLIPVDALTQLARHYGAGARKYDDNQWRKGYEFSKSYAALQRHLNQWWDGEDIDEETGSSHLAAVAWHAFTLMTFQKDHPEFDDRFKPKEVGIPNSKSIDDFMKYGDNLPTVEKDGWGIPEPYDYEKEDRQIMDRILQLRTVPPAFERRNVRPVIWEVSRSGVCIDPNTTYITYNNVVTGEQ